LEDSPRLAAGSFNSGDPVFELMHVHMRIMLRFRIVIFTNRMPDRGFFNKGIPLEEYMNDALDLPTLYFRLAYTEVLI
jgi:hypothetical protein